jgi:glycosyltransferase involved in cell wall biosynthesis
MRLIFLTNHWPYPPGETFLTSDLEALSKIVDEIVVIPVGLSFDETSDPNPISSHMDVRIKPVTSAMKTWNRWGTFRRTIKGLTRLDILRSERSRKPSLPWSIIIGELSQSLLLKDKIAQSLTLSKNDVVVAYWANRPATIAALLSEDYPDIKTISFAHGGDIYASRINYPHLPLQEWALRRLDRILSVSSAGRDHLRAQFPEFQHRIQTHRLGVVSPEIKNPNNTTETLHILSLSSLVGVKRVHLIAQAMPHISRKIRWTHIGDGPERNNILGHLTNLPPHVEVEFLGHLPHHSVLQYMKTEPIDLMLNTSSSEGVPVSIMEAYSHGIPVVATDVGGNSEIVLEEHIIPSDSNPEAIATIINEWSEKTDMREKVRLIQSENFDSTNNAQKFSLVIGEITNESGKVS